ncbi:MAG: hypothetical protein ACRDDZ_00855 [Marinifilaceae bacterium]
MKSIFVLFILLLVMAGCHNQPIGYLQTENAVYAPNKMAIRIVLDEEEDAYRIKNVAPWVSPKLQGVIGTSPIYYEIVQVHSPNGGDTTLFKQLIQVRGGGRMELPLVSDITPGQYCVTLRVYNEGHSSIVKNAFTFDVN